MIVDSHVHLWDPATRAHTWLAAMPALERRFGPEHLEARAGASGVGGAILVQVLNDAAESEEFLTTAAAHRFLLGVVGWVDLEGADVADELARVRSAPGGELLVGVRHLVQDEPDPEFLLRPSVRHGLRAVAAAGLVFDLLVRTPQLPAAIALVRGLEGLEVVLDHGGKPPIATGESERWRSLVATLAESSHVWCKLSGLVTEAGPGWGAGMLRPYVGHLLDTFGPGRLLFGSDWPVSSLVARYGEVISSAEACCAELSDAERDAVFRANALHLYRPVRAPLPPGAR